MTEHTIRTNPRAVNFAGFQRVFEVLIGLSVLGLLIFFNYNLFFRLPYTNFSWFPGSGRVDRVYVAGDLQPGDVVLNAGPVEQDMFNHNLRQVFFTPEQVGTIVPLTVQRGDQRLTIHWQLPINPTQGEILNRFTNQWWLGYIFWAAGQTALLFLRPRDGRWRVFIAFNFLTAIWLVASSLSQTHFAGSAIGLRMAVWLSVPFYWHLHWLLPKPLGKIPTWLITILYGAATLLAITEWFQWLPPNTYAIGFLLAMTGSFVFLLAHFARRPAERIEIGRLAAGTLLAIGLPVLPGLWAASGGFAPSQFLVTLLALPLLPIAYLYAAFRRQVIDLEIRRNRLITVYIFAALLGGLIFALTGLAETWLTFPGALQVVTVAAALLAVLIAAIGFPPFQRFFESKFLQISIPPAHLLETFTARITVSLSEERLVKLLRDEILPSLLVSQSVLYRFQAGSPILAYAHGLSESELPSPAGLAQLIIEAGRLRTRPDGLTWVRLPLTFTMDGTVQGLWLLGRRDPDDSYSAEEIQLLKSLADQTAVALTNIAQAESLRALYQRDIQQAEAQRHHIARELHDHLLNEIARLETSVEDAVATPAFIETCEALIRSVRQTIRDLRPDALNYGLQHALLALRDDVGDRREGRVIMDVETITGTARYDPLVELHVYRIVQQACDNALKHAAPRHVTIRGRLLENRLALQIEDDGKGFIFNSGTDVARLAAQKHYGLAGMFERAAIIRAALKIGSVPGQGTCVELQWPEGVSTI